MLMMLFLWACGPSSDDLVKNLSSNNPVIREDTAKIARNFPSDALEAALMTSLQDPSESVRFNAIESLIIMESTEAVPAIMKALPNEKALRVRRMMVEALGCLKDPQAVPVLIEYLEQNKTNPPLDAIWALGVLEDNQSLDTLSTLRQGGDIYVSYNAMKALRNLRP